ncbi:hypothetical protein OUZ56_010711 [Daphnia magna]|uniref:Uncharacterized protein n=1 Tax=Daphnia magna TaxID=35525 RepID=A0ABQ9YYF0_9CRUS|nr:hypothetical protein OUZ56_010711 [Daphnia magna]
MAGYKKIEKIVRSFEVVNDCAERAIKLISDFKDTVNTLRKPPHGHSGDANRKIIQRLIKPGDGGLHLPKRIFHFRNSYPMSFHFPCNTINFLVQFPGFLLDLCESGL